MKILITGGTGFVGRELGKELVRSGHQLVVLTRNPDKARQELPFPAQTFGWDGSDMPIPKKAFSGVNAIFHLAGEPIAGKRWTSEQKKKILNSRVLGTQKLLEDLKASGQNIDVFVAASGIGAYGNQGDKIVTEKEDFGEGFLAEVCQKWEAASLSIKEFQPSCRIVIPRISIVMGHMEGFLSQVVPMFQKGLGGVLGSGKQWMSWVHIHDLTALLVASLSNPKLSGTLNACADHPITNREFSKTLGATLGVPTIAWAPKLPLKIILGDMSDLLFHSQRASNEKVKQAGFDFKYKELQACLEPLLGHRRQGERKIYREQFVDTSLDNVFEFFSEARNLENITPPFLNFKLVGVDGIPMREGTQIDYKLRVHGISVKWSSLISSWDPKRSFTDIQLRGPYKKWQHQHRFEPLGSGVLITDEVYYSLPAGFIGRLFGQALVDRDVRQIFDYRFKKICQLFPVQHNTSEK